MKTIKPLFLDIDGVLNTVEGNLSWYPHFGEEASMEDRYEKFDERATRWLHGIVTLTGCSLVISSTWRMSTQKFRDMGYGPTATHITLDELWRRRALPPFIDATPKFRGEPRGKEIAAWLEENRRAYKIPTYCILDDDSDMLPEQALYFVKCNSNHGITENEFIKCLSILGLKDDLPDKTRERYTAWIRQHAEE